MIHAIILAAGESKRMGKPKMLLPWGETTVLGQVLSAYRAAGMDGILVVTGGSRPQVEEIVNQHGARSVFNPLFSRGEMLLSLQRGLQSLLAEQATVEAALIGLGDQPQVQEGCIRLIRETFWMYKSRLIVPSYQKRRGHPWLVEKSLWKEILEMDASQSPRDFLNKHAAEIQYVEVTSPSILADLDTPQDYQNYRP